MKLKCSVIICALLAFSARAEWVSIFRPDLNREFEGEGRNQFNYVGSALQQEYVAFSGVQNGFFRMITAHRSDSERNHSITRMSRHGRASTNHGLDIGRGVAMIRLEFRWRPNRWTPDIRNLLDMQIGERFRTGAYNPARGGNQADGPSFASVVWNLEVLRWDRF